MNILNAETEFGLSLLAQTPANVSAVISPLSIALALTLIHAGARSKSREEIRSAFNSNDGQFISHFSRLIKEVKDTNKNLAEVRIANRFYAKRGFEINKMYLENIMKTFEAGAEAIDFNDSTSSAKAMNQFIDIVTGGKIKDIIKESMLKDAVAFIINAVYFKSDWEEKFYATQTINMDFYNDDNTKKSIPFLTESDESRLYAENEHVQMLKLVYKDASYAFSIFLPKKRFGLSKLKGKLTGAKMQELLRTTKSTRVNIKIPKMKIETELALDEVLPELGIRTIFTDRADLSGIANGLKVSKGQSKAIIEVDEQGTVAAAATYFKVVMESLNRKPSKDFIANHPFLFALTFNNHPIFVGRFFV